MHPLAPVRAAFSEENEGAVTYLYGDGTPSSLHTNFFTFLADALDFAAQVLAFDEAITRGRESLERLPRESAAEIERLAGLIAMTKDAIERAPRGSADSPSARVGAETIASLEALSDELAVL